MTVPASPASRGTTRGPTGYRHADEDEKYQYREPAAPLLTGLLLAVVAVHLAGPWTAVPGPGR